MYIHDSLLLISLYTAVFVLDWISIDDCDTSSCITTHYYLKDHFIRSVMGKKKAKHRVKKSNISSLKTGTGKSSKNSKSSVSDGPVRGLNNIGNTCFFNSCLQALNAVISYEDVIVKDSQCCGRVSTNLLMTLQTLQSSHSRSTYNPGALLSEIGKQFPHFKNRRQHDSHELLIALLSNISDEVVADRSHDGHEGESGTGKLAMSDHYQSDPVLSLFGGKCGSILTCVNCNSRFYSVQNCLDVSLQIPGTKHLMMLPRLRTTSASKNNQSKKRASKTTSVPVKSQFAVLESSDDNNSNSDSSDSEKVQDSNSEEISVVSSLMEELVTLVCNDKNICDETSQNKDEEEGGEIFGLESAFVIIEPAARDVVNKKSELSIYTCLNDFSSVEELRCADGNGYICANCSNCNNESVRRDVRKRLLLVSLPPVLILHLKRLLPGGKCSKFVSFPLELSMKDYVGVVMGKPKDVDGNADCDGCFSDHDCLYGLYAVVVHQGSALGGHYIAYVKLCNQWYYTSDTSTRSATETEVLKAEAYMLFYKRVTINDSDNLSDGEVDTEAYLENSFEEEKPTQNLKTIDDEVVKPTSNQETIDLR